MFTDLGVCLLFTQVTVLEIDAVFTWVDGKDPCFLRDKLKHSSFSPPAPLAQWSLQSEYTGEKEKLEGEVETAQAEQRFRNLEELRYALRAIDRFAPWFRRIHIVTNGQVPDWLDTDHPKIRIVTHKTLFSNSRDLPCFNSNAIELHLDKIPHLTEHFVYFNDDFFLGRAVEPSDFLDEDGRHRVFVESNRPLPYHMTDRALMGHMWAYNHRLLDTVIGRSHGRTIFAHTPQMYRKSMFSLMKEQWPNEVDLTIQHKFRTPFDVAMRILYSYLMTDEDWATAQGLDQAPALLTELSDHDYRFVRIGDQKTKFDSDLANTITTRPKFFCVNDEIRDHNADTTNQLKSLLQASLVTLFPVPSRFERQQQQPIKNLSNLPTNIDLQLVTPDVQSLQLIDADYKSGEWLEMRATPESPWKRVKKATSIAILDRSAQFRIGGADADASASVLFGVELGSDRNHPERGFMPKRRFRAFFNSEQEDFVTVAQLLKKYRNLDADVQRVRNITDPLLSVPGDAPMSYFRAADLTLRSGKANLEVLDWLDQALASKIDPFWVSHRRALCQIQLDDRDGVIEAVRAAAIISPDRSRVFVDLIEDLYRLDRTELGLTIAEGLCQGIDNAPEALFLRSLCRLQLDLEDPDYDHLLCSGKGINRRIALWCDRSIAQGVSPEAALRDMDSKVGKGHRKCGFYLARFRFLSRMGSEFEARAMIAKAVGLKQPADELIELAIKEDKLGYPAGAETILSTVRNAFAGDLDVQIAWAAACVRLRRITNEVIAELTEKHTGFVSEAHFWAAYHLSTALLENGQEGNAISLFAKLALAGQSHLPDLIYLAKSAREKGHETASLAFFTRLKNSHPQDGEVLLNWAEMQINSGQLTKDVEEALIGALNGGVQPCWVHYHRARFYREQGHLDQFGTTIDLSLLDEQSVKVLSDLAQSWRDSGDECSGNALKDAIAASHEVGRPVRTAFG